MIELYHHKEIQIRVCGERKRDLLTTVRYELDNIHATFERLRYDTMVPCNCNACKGNQNPDFYPLQKLFKFQEDGQEKIQCGNSYAMVKVQTLVDDLNLSTGQKA